MTICVKSHSENGYHVDMCVEDRHGSSVYIVQACPMIDECRCGHPEAEMMYHVSDREKANATYRRYIRKYCKAGAE